MGFKIKNGIIYGSSGNAQIDDTVISLLSLWSSYKITNDAFEIHTGHGAPTYAIVARKGDMYIDVDTYTPYVCMNYSDWDHITDLTGTTLVFEENIYLPGSTTSGSGFARHGYYDIVFECDSVLYNRFYFYQYISYGSDGKLYLRYQYLENGSVVRTVNVSDTRSWWDNNPHPFYDEKYRTLKILNGSDLAWHNLDYMDTMQSLDQWLVNPYNAPAGTHNVSEIQGLGSTWAPANGLPSVTHFDEGLYLIVDQNGKYIAHDQETMTLQMTLIDGTNVTKKIFIKGE